MDWDGISVQGEIKCRTYSGAPKGAPEHCIKRKVGKKGQATKIQKEKTYCCWYHFCCIVALHRWQLAHLFAVVASPCDVLSHCTVAMPCVVAVRRIVAMPRVVAMRCIVAMRRIVAMQRVVCRHVMRCLLPCDALFVAMWGIVCRNARHCRHSRPCCQATHCHNARHCRHASPCHALSLPWMPQLPQVRLHDNASGIWVSCVLVMAGSPEIGICLFVCPPMQHLGKNNN